MMDKVRLLLRDDSLAFSRKPRLLFPDEQLVGATCYWTVQCNWLGQSLYRQLDVFCWEWPEHKLPKSQYSKQHTAGKRLVENSKGPVLQTRRGFPNINQPPLSYPYPMPARATACSPCSPQTTKVHRTESQDFLFFLELGSTCLGTCSYRELTYAWSHVSDTPVTRAIPAKLSFSRRSLSMSAFVSSEMNFLEELRVNWRPQDWHWNWDFLWWVVPFLMVCPDWQVGQRERSSGIELIPEFGCCPAGIHWRW